MPSNGHFLPWLTAPTLPRDSVVAASGGRRFHHRGGPLLRPSGNPWWPSCPKLHWTRVHVGRTLPRSPTCDTARRRWLRDQSRSRLYSRGSALCRSKTVLIRLPRRRLATVDARFAECRCLWRASSRQTRTARIDAPLNACRAAMQKSLWSSSLRAEELLAPPRLSRFAAVPPPSTLSRTVGTR